MAAGSGSFGSRLDVRPCRARFGAAIVASAFLHAVIGQRLQGGAAGEPARSAPTPPLLSARLVPLAPVPAPVEVEPLVGSARSEADATPERALRQRRVHAREMHALSAAETAEKPPGDGQPPAPDFNWYAARQLDVYPALASSVDVRSAASGARRALLLVRIDDAGAVDDVSVVEAEPENAFDEHARRAFAAARFTPALRNGRPVKSRVLVELSFGPP